MNTLRIELEERWAWIILNRPDKRNALNGELMDELEQVLADFETKAEVRVLILTGEGNAFCSGLDLEVLQQLSRKSFGESLQDSQHYANLLKRIYLHPKPSIAAVNGPAIAGGCGLASACDITLAATTAKLGYTEAKIGFIPAIVSYFLIRSVGEKHAREILLTARLLEAAEAQRLGLVSEVIHPSQLRSRAQEVARQLCENSPQSLKTTKSLLARIPALDLDAALNFACKLNAETRFTPDCVEGVAAFLEKRPPHWR
jgi:methylglutaconyl-CoA hydratase